ncbi:MAG: hypothetical protein FWH12_08640 [Treponema sp.]|nr:hypothetical protein [Treponema sp.]
MCWYCGSSIKDPEPIGRQLRCPDCGKDLRSCMHCRHNLKDGCKEAQAEKIQDKERANFCDWFSLDGRFRQEGKPQAGAAASDSAKAAFNNLFS